MAIDNVPMPIATPFDLRSKDISAAGDGSLQASMMLSRLYPLDWSLNSIVGGMFQHTAKSGAIAAGLAAAAPIFSFQWPSSTLLAVLRRLKLTAWTTSAGFAAAVATFDMFAARPFSVQDTGGVASTITNNELRSTMSAPAASIVHAGTGALTAGTRTLASAPFETWTVAAPAGANTPFASAPTKLFEKLQGEHPLVMAQNEGFVVAATVPATGVWQFAISIEWDELPQF